MPNQTLQVVASLAQDIWAVSNSGYAEAHDASEGSIDTGNTVYIGASLGEGATCQVNRGFISFYTSLGIASIVSVALTYTYTGGYNQDANHATLHVVQGVHGATLVASDFGKLKDKTTSGGLVSFDNIIDGITFNTIGKRWVKPGITRLGLRLAGDINNTVPHGANYILLRSLTLTIEYIPRGGNPNIDQLIYQHAERMER